MDVAAAIPPADTERAELAWLQALAEPYLRIHDVTVGAMDGRALRLRGELRSTSDELYAALAPAVRAHGRTLLLREDEGLVAVLALRGVMRPKANNRWLPIVLAVLTFCSMVFSYAAMHASAESITWAAIEDGLGDALAFTVSLLTILVAHELGHYVVARRLGVAVTLPYLIPMPLSLFGTMGALIQIKDIPPNRRAMLLIGAAGPLAGLAVGVPILALGIALSDVNALPSGTGYLMEGNSLLYAVLKYAIKGEWLPSATRDIMLHPVAMSGWAGLLVTSFNLVPAGQLDGGHVATALLGHRSRNLTWAVIVILLLMGGLWRGWWLWAALAFLSSRVRVEPLDSVTDLTPRQRRLAVILLLLAIVTFTPIPVRFL